MMKQNCWCLIFLIVYLTAVVLVKSESFTEVDEDGNEIEVKRFYIEGRQLNSGKRQCVETRRLKRAYNYAQADENDNDEIAISAATAPSNIPTEVSNDEDDMDKDEDDMVKDEEPVDLLGMNNDANDNDNDNDEQNMKDNNEKKNESENEGKEKIVLSLPLIAQITHSNGEQSALGSTNIANNGIFIIHTNKPPKVNPKTHAIFELRPVQQNDDYDNNEVEDENDEGDDDSSYEVYHEEINPIVTSAIWSSDNDDLGNLNDDNGNDVKQSTKDTFFFYPKPIMSISSSKRPLKQPSKRPSKRPSKNPSKRPSKFPLKPSSQSTNTNNKKQKVNNKRRLQSQNNGPYRRRNHNLNKSRRGQLNNLHAHKIGTNTFTKSETFTRTGTPNEESDVNCIIIDKTTTPRPFWGLFGRSADGSVEPTVRPYGRRKRINFSIPA